MMTATHVEELGSRQLTVVRPCTGDNLAIGKSVVLELPLEAVNLLARNVNLKRSNLGHLVEDCRLRDL